MAECGWIEDETEIKNIENEVWDEIGQPKPKPTPAISKDQQIIKRLEQYTHKLDKKISELEKRILELETAPTPIPDLEQLAEDRKCDTYWDW